MKPPACVSRGVSCVVECPSRRSFRLKVERTELLAVVAVLLLESVSLQ